MTEQCHVSLVEAEAGRYSLLFSVFLATGKSPVYHLSIVLASSSVFYCHFFFNTKKHTFTHTFTHTHFHTHTDL